MHIAASQGMVSVVQDLLSRGANVLAEDEDGHNPALACAPNQQVADCLALILSAMLQGPNGTSSPTPLSPDNPNSPVARPLLRDSNDFLPTHNVTF